MISLFNAARVVALTISILMSTALSGLSQTQDDRVRQCLTIADINARVDCLEGGVPTPNTTNTTQVPNRTAQPLPTPSFDCGLAKSPSERAICRDAALAETDAKMGQLLQQTLRIGYDAKLVLDDQRSWLTERDKQCGQLGDPQIKQCLTERTRSRVHVLANAIASRPNQASVEQAPPARQSSAIAQPKEAERTRIAANTEQAIKAPAQNATEGSAATPLIIFALLCGTFFFGRILIAARRRRREAVEEEQRRAEEWARLVGKYGEHDATLIAEHKAWQGMTAEQLLDSWGHPADIDKDIYREHVRETWKYQQTGKNRFKKRVRLENGTVIGLKIN